MPQDFQSRLQEKTYKRQWKLMNRVGQLGRQGVHGPVEQSEKRMLHQRKTAQHVYHPPKSHKV